MKAQQTILVVDDDALVLDSLRAELGRSYHVLTAATAREALEIFSRNSVDCVVSDYRMPGTNGMALLREIGLRDPFVGRVLITAFSDAEARDGALTERGVLKVAKPWRDELEIAVQRSLELRVLEQKLERSLRRFDLGVEVERQFRRETDPVKLMRLALSQVARLEGVQACELTVGDNARPQRLGIATAERVIMEQMVQFPPAIRHVETNTRLDRCESHWRYAIPLWQVQNDIWWLRTFLDKLRQDELSWIDFVAEQLVDAMERTMLFSEVKRHRESSAAHQGQLITMEKMAALGLLAAGVAHEINNPAAYVRANLGIIESDLADILQAMSESRRAVEELAPPELRRRLEATNQSTEVEKSVAEIGEVIAETREGVERIIGVALNLKTFAREDSGQRERVSVQRCLESSLAMVTYRYKTGLVVEKSYQEVPDVLARAGEVGQVFLNILINAAQAMKGKGSIFIRVWAESAWVYTSIRDTGPGIPPEIQGRMFEPLFTTKAAGEGTGLGLSISKEIVERYGGLIEVA
ncbi:MAG: response regulator, partial [Myxococcales bacterium]|nr:response regulator [Myxococcales bacterium]